AKVNEPYVGPLGELLGFGTVTPVSAEDLAKDAEQERQVQDQIVSCMQAQGFTYVAVTFDRTPAASDPYSLPPKEFAEQYGYGISTIDYSKTTNTDPNTAITSAMSVPQLK